MTEQEAIQRVNHAKNFVGFDYSNPLIEPIIMALNMAIEALQKQIPQSPRWMTDITTYPICPTCGQKIDWRD